MPGLNETAGIWNLGCGITMFEIFKKFPQLKYGISQKRDGSMKLVTAQARQAEDRDSFLAMQGIPIERLVVPIQSHSTRVEIANEDNAAKAVRSCDALVTKNFNLFLSVTVADCFPVYFFCKKTGAIALAHCGWRGTVGGLAVKTLKHMRSAHKDVLVGIGPGIQSCHFEVKADILPKFKAYPKAIIFKGGKIFVDLPKILVEQLLAARIQKKHIEISAECTYHLKNKYFSFRRDKKQVLEAMIAYIGKV